MEAEASDAAGELFTVTVMVDERTASVEAADECALCTPVAVVCALEDATVDARELEAVLCFVLSLSSSLPFLVDVDACVENHGHCGTSIDVVSFIAELETMRDEVAKAEAGAVDA